MKKLVLLFSLITFFVISNTNATTSYSLNDDVITSVIDNATEMSAPELLVLPSISPFNGNDYAQISGRANPWVAWVLCLVVGGFGIHRHYLGTSNIMWLLYCITCGGIFGIVPMVDWVVLLIGAIKDDIRDYEKNDKFFMWM